MAYETYRWIHFCMEESAEAETGINWLQKRYVSFLLQLALW